MRLLVHADDLGMSAEVNAAILGSLAAGSATSTSALATGPAFHAAMESLPPGTDLGVHLDLTEFPALTRHPALERVRRAAIDDPCSVLEALARCAREDAPAILEEWSAQVAAVRARHPVTHLDSHHHSHWQPPLWPILRDLMQKTGIRAVRCVGAWHPGGTWIQGRLQAARATRFRLAFRGAVTTGGFANATAFRALAEGRRLRRDTMEVMVHPGNPHSDRYAAELEWIAGWRRDVPRIGWGALVMAAQSPR